MIEALGEKYGFTVDTAVKDIAEDVLNKIFFGSDEVLKLSNTPLGVTSNYFMTFEGVVNYVGNQEVVSGRKANGKGREQYVQYHVCPECGGTRLKKSHCGSALEEKT